MTAQVTVFVSDPAVNVEVKPGNPPVDQSAQVAQLTADLAAMTADRDVQVGKLNAVKAKAALLDTNDTAQDQIRADIHAIVG